MKDEKFILYVQTSDNPERQYSPLVLAQTAKAMGLNPKVYYLGQGLRVLLPGAAGKDQVRFFSFSYGNDSENSCNGHRNRRLRSIKKNVWLGES